MRKARTRTLIQLGGLIEKSGLFEKLGIIPGIDLQKDESMKSLVLGLLGGLLTIKNELYSDRSILRVWELKAKTWLDNQRDYYM